MATLADATLSGIERRILERFVGLLCAELGPDLHAVWLYGSRARGERPMPDSDIDVLIVSSRDSFEDLGRAIDLVDQAAAAEGSRGLPFAPRIYSPERLAQRRDIRSFFIQEVDRDKIVLFGEP